MNNDRDQMRQTICQAWQKHQAQQPLDELESALCNIIREHPEYHADLELSAENKTKDYTTDSNPFLHIALHLSLHEQLSTNRPHGIKAIYKKLAAKYSDPHQIEHLMLDIMANLMWEAQQAGKLPDESVYLNKLEKL